MVDLRLESFLIQDTRNMNDYGTNELQYRWFYHLSLAGTPKETWRHGEFADDGTLAIPFDFFWAEITAIPKLVADYGDHIDLLVDSLATRESL